MKPRNDAERQRIVANTAETSRWLNTIPHTAGHVRVAIEARIEDGLAAASLDSGNRRSAEQLSPEERVALRGGDRAMDHLDEFDGALAMWAQATDVLNRLRHTYRRWEGKPDIGPGKGACPPSKCEDCWNAGVPNPRDAAVKRYRRWCRADGEWRADHDGHPAPTEVIRAREQYGVGSWRFDRAVSSA